MSEPDAKDTHKTHPEPQPSVMEETELNFEQAGNIKRYEDHPKSGNKTSDSMNDDVSEHEISEGHMKSNDQQVPDIICEQSVNKTSYDTQSADQCVPHTVPGDIENSEDLVCLNSNVDVVNTDQNVSATTNVDVVPTDQNVNAASNVDVVNTDRNVNATTNVDVVPTDQNVNAASNVDIEHSNLHQPDNSSVNVENKYQLKRESSSSDKQYHDKPKSELISSDVKDNDETRSDQTKREPSETRNDQAKLEPSETRNDQAKLEPSEKRNENNEECPEGYPPLQHDDRSAPDGSILSAKPTHDLQGAGDSLSQPLASGAVSPDRCGSSISFQASSLHGMSSVAENFIDRNTPSFPATSAPSIPTACSQLYPDLERLAPSIPITPSQLHRDLERNEPSFPPIYSPSKVYPDLQEKQRKPLITYHEKDYLQGRQAEPLHRHPEEEFTQMGLDSYDIKSTSVRKREIKSSLVSGTDKAAPFNSDVKEPLSLKIILLVIFLFFLMLSSIAVYYWSNKSSDRSDIPPFEKFTDHVKNMQQHFPSQSNRLWTTVKASTTSIYRHSESMHPAVLIMASSTLHASVTLCLAKQISFGFDLSWGLSPNMSLVDINLLEQLDAAKQKLELDNILNSAFSVHKRKSFIIDNLQVLEPSSALLFYKYCDNDHAPFKDVMILFTLYYDDKEGKIENANAVEDYLEKLWSRDLPVDKVKPLMSRVANNVVIVTGENSATIADVCS